MPITQIAASADVAAGRARQSAQPNLASPSPFELTVLRDCANPTVDIIAVSALGVDARQAWSHEETIDGKRTGRIVNWLKDGDLLPQTITSARVLGFSYNLGWLAGADAKFWNLGTELMREICWEREYSQDPSIKQRPIIFIGHSLSGIVIEQGLVAATGAQSEHQLISKCTVGVVSLGTPHNVTSLREWGDSVFRITKAFGISEELSLVKDLKDGSASIFEIMHKYAMWLGRYAIEVAQFYEVRRTSYGAMIGGRWTEMVVPQENACIPGYRKALMDSDHFKLAVFEGPDDDSYKKVIAVLQKMAAEAPKKSSLRFQERIFVQDNSQIPAVHLECQKALFVRWPDADFAVIRRRLGERTPETCEWLLLKKEYTEWLLGNRPQVLRVTASPGMGKSMLTTFLVDLLTERLKVTPDVCLAYHFCDSTNHSTTTGQAVLRQLLFQLFQQRPERFHFIQKAYDIEGKKLFHDFDALLRIFKETAANFGEGELYIVIDALDKCESRNLIMKALEGVAKSSLDVRILFTCRPEHDIEILFQHNDTKIKTLRIESKDIEDDLRKYVEDKIPKLCQRHEWGDKEMENIRRAFLLSTNGSYAPWSSVLKELDKTSWRGDIDRILHKLPRARRETVVGPPDELGESFQTQDDNVKFDEAEFKSHIQEMRAAAAEREKKEADQLEKSTVETTTTPVRAGGDYVKAPAETDKPSALSWPTEQPEEATDDKGHWFDKFSRAPRSDLMWGPISEDEEHRVSNLDSVPQGPPRFEDIIAPGSNGAIRLTGAGTPVASGPDAFPNAAGLRQRIPVSAAGARFDLGGRLLMDTGPMLPIVQPSRGRALTGVRWQAIVSQFSTGLGRVVTVVRTQIFRPTAGPAQDTAPPTPSSPLQAFASNYALHLEVSTYLLSPTAIVSMLGIAIASALLAVGVYKLFKKESLPDYRPATWDDSDFYLGASNNCWLFLGAIFSLILTVQHVREHTNYLTWLAVWVFSGLCIIMCGLGIGFYTKSPAWCQLLAGCGNALQVLIIFLSIRILEKTREAEQPVRQRIKLLLIEIHEKRSRCELLEEEKRELENELNVLRNQLAVGVTKPPGTYQFTVPLGRRVLEDPVPLDGVSRRGTGKIAPLA